MPGSDLPPVTIWTDVDIAPKPPPSIRYGHSKCTMLTSGSLPISRPAVRDLRRSLRVRFQTDPIIDRVVESLLAAQVAFRRLYRNVSQQKLNLLQLPASLMAQPGACTPEVVGC